MTVRNEVRYSTPEAPFHLPPELVELKALVREIVEAECIPLEAEYLEAQRANREVESGRRHPYQGPLTNAQWERLTKISSDAGVHDIHLPVEHGVTVASATAT